jgi:hypothetical protein
MKKLLLILLILFSGSAFAQVGAITNYCVLGATQASVSGLKSSNDLQGIVPQCTVTVYLDGYYAVKSATYTSGGTVTGTSGKTCVATFVGGTTDGTATITLTGTNTIAANTAFVITAGGIYATTPTTATLSNGTATCSGTATVSAVMTPALATIYSDKSSTALTNPFTANSDGSWLFYAATSKGYDVKLSGGVSPNIYLVPVTLTGLFPGASYSSGCGSTTGIVCDTAYGGTGINSSASTGVAQVDAGVWSISTALADGTTATTQTTGDTSTDVATDAFVGATVGNYLPLSGGTLTGDLILPGMTLTSLTGYLYANGSSAVTASTTIPIAALSYDSTTVNGQTCTLGGSCTVTAAATGISVGTTTVSNGTTGYILYDNAGILGNLATTGSGSVVLATSPSISGLMVTSSFTATGLVTNSDLTNASTTVNGQTCTLGGSCTVTATGITVGTTTVSSGTSGYILYDNSGTLGNLGTTGSGNVVLMTSPSVSGLTVTSSFTAIGLVTNTDLANASTTVNGQTCTLGGSCTVTAAATGITVGTTTVSSGTTGYILYDNGGTLGDLATTGSGSVVLATSPSVSGLTVTSSFTATGLVTNTDLANASTTVNGSTCTLGSSCTVTAAAGTLTGTTLNSTVVSSSLTSVGTITSGVWNGTLIGAAYGGTGIDSSASTGVAQVSAGVWSISTVVSATHLVGISSTPTITVGTGAGTGGTATCAGFHCSDMNGVVNVTVGTSPSANATVFTVTFASPYGNIVNCVYNVTNETLATGVYVPAYLTEAAAYIAIVAPTGNAWTAGSEYSVNYFCGQ